MFIFSDYTQTIAFFLQITSKASKCNQRQEVTSQTSLNFKESQAITADLDDQTETGPWI